MLWNPTIQQSYGDVGSRGNNFGFTIVGSDGLGVVIEACTTLARPNWIVVQTVTLTSGSAQFNDTASTNYQSRLYRLSMP